MPDRLGGVIILSPLSPVDDLFLKNSFRLVQSAAQALRQGAREGAAVFFTVSRLDGAFGLMGLESLQDPLTGGLAGLSKTARHEWPGIECKALDLARDYSSADEAAAHVIEELFIKGPVEVGLSRGGRCTLELSPSHLVPNGKNCPFSRGDALIITGGARGVTAECAVKVARGLSIQEKPALVLLGRSPEPLAEPAWLAAAAGENMMKKAIMDHSEEKLSPALLRKKYQQASANREILRTIRRIEEAGARAIYRSVDIRDKEALGRVVDDIREQVGPVKGLIHGAGVIADKFIVDKTGSEFDYVYDTKVVGLRNLIEVLKNDSLTVMVFFSSSTERGAQQAGPPAVAAAPFMQGHVNQLGPMGWRNGHHVAEKDI